MAAVRPGHDGAFALALPEAKAAAMDLFLAQFPETLPAGVHAVPMLDPVERVWSYLRERFLPFRLHRSEQAIVDALCAAWNALRDETGPLTTLTGTLICRF